VTFNNYAWALNSADNHLDYETIISGEDSLYGTKGVSNPMTCEIIQQLS
jgi:hypothetical protein